MLDWLFGTRRKLFRKDVSQEEQSQLQSSLWQARFLSSQKRDQLTRWSRVFIAEKNWEGCSGLHVTKPMQWSIASAAGLMVLEYPDWYFDKTATVLVYPTPYRAKVEPNFGGAMPPILGGEYSRAGETIYRGPVVLNWNDVSAASQGFNHGNHLVIHEFAHQLDMINGPSADGLPPLPGQVDEGNWIKLLRAEYQAAREMVSDGHRILMDDYGLTQESEFFAVASELYFQVPQELAEYHPNVYRLLKQFYVTDTAQLLSK